MRFSAKLGTSQEQLELHPSPEFLVEEIVKSYTVLEVCCTLWREYLKIAFGRSSDPHQNCIHCLKPSPWHSWTVLWNNQKI